MARAFIGLGGNVGDVVANFRNALVGLASAGCRIVGVSRLYRTEALLPPQATAPAPEYLNAACCVETDLSPQALLTRLQTLEAAAGRVRAERWGNRPLDMDLLLYDQKVLDAPGLQVPHPELPKRPFVLLPLADIDASTEVPETDATVASLLSKHARPWEGVRLEVDPTWVTRRG